MLKGTYCKDIKTESNYEWKQNEISGIISDFFNYL